MTPNIPELLVGGGGCATAIFTYSLAFLDYPLSKKWNMSTIFQQPVLAKEATAQEARALANSQLVSASQAHETFQHCCKHLQITCAITCV